VAIATNTPLFIVTRGATASHRPIPLVRRNLLNMLLADCRPGAVVTYHRPPFRFDAILVRVTLRGNVVLCAMRRDGYRIAPLFLSVPPGRIERPATAPQVVGQTAPRT